MVTRAFGTSIYADISGQWESPPESKGLIWDFFKKSFLMFLRIHQNQLVYKYAAILLSTFCVYNNYLAIIVQENKLVA